MAIVYLKPGQQFTLIGGPVRVGISCSVADLSIEWSGVEEYGGNVGIGTIVVGELTFEVHIEQSSGALFYDNERGY